VARRKIETGAGVVWEANKRPSSRSATRTKCSKMEQALSLSISLRMPSSLPSAATFAEIRNHEKLTGHHALKEDRERCLSAGMDAHVTKPIHPEELFRVIQEVLQSSSAWDPSTTLTPAPSSR
jgi:DNA-binding NarL/FixJ family response regulator